MKKATILFAFLIGMILNAQAQKDSSKANVKPSGAAFHFQDSTHKQVAVWTGKDSVLVIKDLSSIKVIEIAGKRIAASAFANYEVLFPTMEWIAAIFNILENAPTGLSKNQLTMLQSILVPYIERLQQQSQQKAPVKKQD